MRCNPSSRSLLRFLLLYPDRFYTGDVATNLAHPRGVLKLSGRTLEAQVELLLLQLCQLILELIERHLPDLLRFHRRLAPHGALPPSPSHHAPDEARLDRQFGRPELKRFARGRFGHAVELEHDAAGLDANNPQLRRALARSHAHLGRLFGDRQVRKDADPHAARALHRPGDRPPRRLDLPRGHAVGFDRLEPEGAEIQGRAALGLAVDATLEGLAVFA